MRVLLARRFRGNSNAAFLQEEDGEYPQEAHEVEEDEAESSSIAVPDQPAEPQIEFVQTKANLVDTIKEQEAEGKRQRQSEDKNQNQHQQPLGKIIFASTENGETDLEERSFSGLLPRQPKQEASPQRQRRRRRCIAAQEENDRKRSCFQASSSSVSVSSAREEASSLDLKPRARETRVIRPCRRGRSRINSSNKRSPRLTPTGKPPAVGKNNTVPKEAARSWLPSVTIQALPNNRLQATNLNNNNKMVSGGSGRNHRQHGGRDSGDGDDDGHLRSWLYNDDNNNNNNQSQHHPASRIQAAEWDEAYRSHPESETQAVPMGFAGLYENDPASARGDVSTASPERHGQKCHARFTGYVVTREGSPSSAAAAAATPRPKEEDDPAVATHDPRNQAYVPSGYLRLSRREGSFRMNNTSSDYAAGLQRAALPAWKTPPPRYSGIDFNNNTTKKRGSKSANEAWFRAALKKERGLEIREQDGDGNCLFRAISLQVYGDPSMHGDVRKQCMDHMERDQEHFSQFVTGEPFLQYVARTRQDGVHGNNPEIQASSELFNRPIEVFTPENGSSPLNIFHAEYKTGDVPIRLSYHDGNHYNAVIDPLMPTAGLGLGLPDLKPPGYADKLQMAKAVAESIDAAADKDETELQQVMKASQIEYNNKGTRENADDDLQRAIKESKLSVEHMSSNNALSLSDMDATYFELEQAALERSLQSYSQKEEGKKQSAKTSRKPKTTNDVAKPKTTKGYHKAPAAATAAAASSATTYLPCPSQENIPVAAAASSSSVAVARRSDSPSSSSPTRPQRLLPVEEYPSSVQELVMNGFPLSTVVKAFDLVGNNFDHMLNLCLAKTSSNNE